MSSTWADLRARVLSAIVMVVVGAGAIWAGGMVFATLVAVATGAMVVEFCRLVAPDSAAFSRPSAAFAAGSIIALCFIVFSLGDPWLVRVGQGALIGIMLTILTALPRRALPHAAPYLLMILLAGGSLILLRLQVGMSTIVWLVCVVVASDIGGYFAGRAFGGPKFWPAISPKKTWSGTVAGWLGAALVGLGFVLWAGADWALVAFSPLVAFAGQMGDITESWFKRRAGVKDSSNLIPGHGGLLDRFDALIFAAVLVTAPALVIPALPLP